MTQRYGKRTGVTALMRLAKQLCRLYSVFSATIDEWVHDHASEADYATFRSWAALIHTVCVILDAIPDD